ncbi:MAG TPA: hypothetical protein VLT62_19885 [Candidatus Methylomirabilis sp.]|nr:hypothetical protein [Candidatus Methylomirabilis sp.]HSB82570.1 hypothetical protein [Candidatus Methylomirabilis sp.]
MRRIAQVLLLTLFLAVVMPADAGHELPIYPSYYPHEIQIQVVAPGEAVALLQDARIHAYLGGGSIFGGNSPKTVGHVEFLGSYLVLSSNPASRLLNGKDARCTAMATVLHSLSAAKEAFVYHPYPVTPYDMDYLPHFDLAQAAKERYRHGPDRARPSAGLPVKVKAMGKLAERLVGSRWRAEEMGWDLMLEEIDAADLIQSHMTSLNGWLAPPWLKEGWFHAYLILADRLEEAGARQTADSILQRLERGEYEGLKDKLNLERRLVTLLSRSCGGAVVGYTVKREYFNSEFSAGIENIAYDSHTGFNSPLFIRTAKLKDFPWNGWLRLGIAAKPSAAWNPIAGFTDPVGRLIWFALGDPALLPAPYGGSWVPNRIGDFQLTRRDEVGQ